MCKKKFQEAISPNDHRLKEPHLAVFVIPTEKGPKVPLIKRRKNIEDANGVFLHAEEWYDLPGGKSDPVKINGIIRDIEDGPKAAQRETREELGIFVQAGDLMASIDHPAKPNLQRHFYEATYLGGKLKNMVPDEHDHVELMEPEMAIYYLGNRIPKEARTFIHSETARLENIAEQAIPCLQVVEPR